MDKRQRLKRPISNANGIKVQCCMDTKKFETKTQKRKQTYRNRSRYNVARKMGHVEIRWIQRKGCGVDSVTRRVHVVSSQVRSSDLIEHEIPIYPSTRTISKLPKYIM